MLEAPGFSPWVSSPAALGADAPIYGSKRRPHAVTPQRAVVLELRPSHAPACSRAHLASPGPLKAGAPRRQRGGTGPAGLGASTATSSVKREGDNNADSQRPPESSPHGGVRTSVWDDPASRGPCPPHGLLHRLGVRVPAPWLPPLPRPSQRLRGGRARTSAAEPGDRLLPRTLLIEMVTRKLLLPGDGGAL